MTSRNGEEIETLHAETCGAIERWKDLPREARGRGEERERIIDALRSAGLAHGLSQPWVCEERIGYRTIRERVHLDSIAALAGQGPRSSVRHALRQLRWHDDQLRRGRSTEPTDKAFLGDGLYDAVAHGWLTACRKDSGEVRTWLAADRDYGRQSHILVTRDVIGHFKGTLELHVVRNEVSAKATLAEGVHWRRGYMRFDKIDLPDTVVLSLKGRPLDDLLDHPFTTGRGIMIASVVRNGEGRVTIGTTDAARHALANENPWVHS